MDVSVCNGSVGVVDGPATNLASILANTDENENRTMYEVIAEAMKMSNGEYSIEELLHVLQTPAAVDYLADNEQSGETAVASHTAIEEFCQLMDNDRMSEAFVNLLKKDENLFKSIVSGLKTSGLAEDTVNIAEILQAAVVDSIQEKAQCALVELMGDPNHDQLTALLKKSGERTGTCHPEALKDLNKDDDLFTIINRVLIMEELAQDDDEYRELIDSLEKTPAHATSSDKLRELIRQSGALSYAPTKKLAIETSKDVPLSLFYTNNQLAIEEFFLKSGQTQRHCPKAFLIIKKGIQAVIPRESSHEVLAGKIAYTVLDENGIRHFQPMNVLNALKITPRFLNRFSMYTCDIAEELDNDTLSSSSSHDGEFEDVYCYGRPLSRRGSLRVPAVNGGNGAPYPRRGDRLDSYGYLGSTPPSTPLSHRKTAAPAARIHHQKHYPLHHVENVKTLPMAMRIAIKASLSREAPIMKSSSRDYLHRSSSLARLK
ncbi:hypothetical protein pipiens_000132, partial [Culex pipiens pipiens]